MRCQYCNENIPDDSIFCSNCGKDVRNQSQPENDDAYTKPQHTVPEQPLADRPDYNTFQPQSPNLDTGDLSAQHNTSMGIPAGYIYDPQSGLYYISKYVVDPQTRRQVQQVTYYNAQTKLYNTVNYPNFDYNQQQAAYQYQYQQQPTKKVWPIVVAVIVALVVLISIGFSSFVASISKMYDDEYYNNSYSNWFEDDDYNNDFKDYGDYKSHRDGSISDSDMLPVFDQPDIFVNDFPQLSSFLTKSVEDGDYVYFSSESYYDYSHTLMRYNSQTKKVDTVIDVGDDYYISSFAVSTDKIIFAVGERYYPEGMSLQYFAADKTTFDYDFLFEEIDSDIAIYNGYLYLIDSYNHELVKIGVDSDSTYLFKSYDLNIKYEEYLAISPFSIIDDFLYIRTYDDNLRDYIYKYNLKTMDKMLIFTGQPDFTYEDLFIDGNTIYYTKYDLSENENYNIIIASSILGELNSEKIYYTYKNDYKWPDEDIFIGRSENNIFYQQNDTLVKANLDAPSEIVDSISLNITDDPLSMTKDWIITDDGILSTADFSFEHLSFDEKTPLVNYKHTSPKGSNSSSYSNSNNYFSPFDYSGSTLFTKNNEEALLKSVGYVVSELPKSTTAYFYEDTSLTTRIAGAWLQDPAIKEMFVDGNNKLDTELYLTSTYFVFGYEYENFENSVKAGLVNGLREKDGDIYFEPSWKPIKSVKSVSINNLDADEYKNGYIKASLTTYYKDGSNTNFIINGSVDPDYMGSISNYSFYSVEKE